MHTTEVVKSIANNRCKQYAFLLCRRPPNMYSKGPVFRVVSGTPHTLHQSTTQRNNGCK